MSILILTGPPASGKNSVAPLIARQRKRCAVIDVDQVRWMLVQPHAAPWEGADGKHQMRLGVENTCLLAQRFTEDHCDVLILDFLWDYTISIYRQRLKAYQPQVIQLMPTLAETLRRNHARGWLPAHEVEMLYDAQAHFRDYDTQIDNTNLTVEELAQRILEYLGT